MNIAVLIKQTFDSEERIVMDNGVIVEDDATWVINPYDEYAIEEAVLLRDAHGGEVTVVTVGPERAVQALRTALAMGANHAVRLDPEELQLDEAVTSQLLASFLKERGFDLIVCGSVSIDHGTGQVGPRVAALLDMPQVTSVTRLTMQGQTAMAEREAEGDIETVEVQLPALVAAQQGLNEPRYPSLPGIMKAKRMPIETIDASSMELDAQLLQAQTVIVEQRVREKRGAVQMLEGELDAKVSRLLQVIHSKHA